MFWLLFTVLLTDNRTLKNYQILFYEFMFNGLTDHIEIQFEFYFFFGQKLSILVILHVINRGT